jgi:hypothetical protein
MWTYHDNRLIDVERREPVRTQSETEPAPSEADSEVGDVIFMYSPCFEQIQVDTCMVQCT